MIGLATLKLLDTNGFGTLDIDGSITENGLYFEKLTQNKISGVALLTRGDQLSRNTRMSQAFDLMSRGTDDVDGKLRLKNIISFMSNLHECNLVYEDSSFKGVMFEPISNIENIGLDDNDRIIYSATIKVTYQEEN
jgi:hypothetical protein